LSSAVELSESSVGEMSAGAARAEKARSGRKWANSLEVSEKVNRGRRTRQFLRANDNISRDRRQ
jgi:hypothetical protein